MLYIRKRAYYLPALALALFSVAVLTSAAETASVDVGDTAPAFTLGPVEGKKDITLADYAGRPVLLVFWVSWCPHCQRELPVIQKVYAGLQPRISTVGVSVDLEMREASAFVKDYKLTFPNAFAGTERGDEVQDSYGIQGVPTIYVLDSKGVVKARFLGSTSEESLRKELSKLGVK